MRRRAWPLLAAPLAVLAAFFALPLAAVLARAAGDASAWAWIATSPFVSSRLALAFGQALASVALTLAVAVPLAWLHHARRVPFSRLQLAVHAAPFVLPVFVVVFGLQALLGDHLRVFGPLGAVVLAHAYYNYGFAARLLHAALERRPRRLEDAARVLGAPPLAAGLRTTLPLLAPAAGAVALLVFLFSFTSFGVVLFLGDGRVSTLDTLIYENLAGSFPTTGRAAALGALQLGLNLVLLLVYVALARRAARTPREAPRPAPRAGFAAMTLSIAALGVALAPPAAVLVGAFRVRGAWTLEAWRALADRAHPSHLGGFDLGLALGLSIGYALATAFLALALAALLAYGLARSRGATRALVEAAATLPLGTSSVLLGLGYALAFGVGGTPDLRGTYAVVLLAHTLVAFPFAARALVPALDAHDRRLDDAAAVLGAKPSEVARRIHLPLLRAPLAVAGGLAAAFSLGDFGASLILMRPDTMSLSVWIARHGGLGSFDPILRAQSMALTAVLMLLTIAAFLVAERFRAEGDA
ncbi:MAG TPA: ABC transporter permease subunit [Candidatus Thermoplasmatota archaeon]|nr:ABC transporter permease subunit [Candidatus Thermoplasmatota archaeon]